MLSFRLVLDTNVIISAALKPDGLQRTVFLLAITSPARLYVSAPILSEYLTVLSRPELRTPKGLRRQFFDLIKKYTHVVLPACSIHATSDPADNIFLECADEASADYLITGDQRHFPQFWKKTKIITSREFITLVAPHLTG